jgi:hypothetical protein
VERVFISKRDGTSYPATTNEISMSGLSASSMALFQPGDEVHLSLVAGHEIVAVVLRKIGTVYGFEFALLPTEVAAEIHNLCRGLVPFGSSPTEA